MKNTRLMSVLVAVGILALPLCGRADDSATANSDTAGDSTSSAPSTTATPPTIGTQPASVVANAGDNVTFSVVATGTGTLRYRWFRNGRRLEGATTATLTLNHVAARDAGIYTVVVGNDGGRVASNGAALTVNVVAGTVTTSPVATTVDAGANATLGVTAAGTGLTYQWFHDGHPLSGATAATLALTNVGILDAGAYTAVVSTGSGVAAIAPTTLSVHTDARLTNMSTRGEVGTGDDQLIIGFVIHGQASKQVLMRAVGPTLKTQFGLTNALATPKLTLRGYSHGQPITDTNTVWGGGSTLAQAFAQVGAFPLPATSADSALLETLDGGMYTASVTGTGGASGIALAELYDADSGSPASEFVNISARARVGAQVANTLIAGFAIQGTTSDTVLIRGVGPSLGDLFGLHGVLQAPQVTLYDASGKQIAVNAGWGINHRTHEEDPETENDIDSVNDRVGAFHLERGSRDAALLVTLPPGAYTANVTGVSNSTGIALVEVYEVH